MKRILLTGRNGQVGWELQRSLSLLGRVFAFNSGELDLAQPDRVRSVVRDIGPEIIVNAAAYTAVDKAESEPDMAVSVNGTAPGVLAEEARRMGALLVHYSTDYVFDGTKQAGYTEDDEPCPVSAYGRSKLNGEQAIHTSGVRHLILRTSWVYGLRGQNFLRTILRLADERDELRVVDDQVGAPTWSRTIAEATALILAAPEPIEGLFHLTSAGETTWFGFAQAILAATRDRRKREPRLTPISTSEYPSPATRPANSRLDCTRLTQRTGLCLPQWQDSLDLCLRDE